VKPSGRRKKIIVLSLKQVKNWKRRKYKRRKKVKELGKLIKKVSDN